MEKIKRSIYIGLGGTGIKTLEKIKKLYLETYGEIPSIIRFLGVDTYDNYEAHIGTAEQSSLSVCLEKSEQCHIGLQYNAKGFYYAHENDLKWMAHQTCSFLSNLNYNHCLSKAEARFAFIYNIYKLQAAFDYAMANITIQREWDDSEQYSHSDYGKKVDIYVIFSLAGFTGSGIFIDVAYLLRKMFGRRANLYCYSILPDIFVRDGSATNHIFSNAFGALQDLDFLMSLKPSDRPVTFNWITQKYNEDDFTKAPTPFDWVYMIDNRNIQGYVINKLSDLLDIISLNLFCSATVMGYTKDVILDDVGRYLKSGPHDILNKHSWISSLGVSSILFESNLVAEDYARKAIQRLVQRAKNFYGDSVSYAKDWMCKVEIYDKDEVINYLYDLKANKYYFDIEDKKNPKVEIEAFCSHVIKKALDKVKNTCENLKEQKTDKLSHEVSALLKTGDFCITSAHGFLESVRSQIEHCKSEMVSEKKEKEEQSNTLAERMEITVNTLKEYATLFFKTKKRLLELSAEVTAVTEQYVENEIEIIKRQYAIQFYDAIVASIEEHLSVVERISSFMSFISTTLENDFKEYLCSSHSRITDIDLTREMILKQEVDDNTLIFDNFYSYLNGNGLEKIETAEELLECFWAYAKSLPQYNHIINCSVTDIIKELPDEKVDNIFRYAKKHAEPFLAFNFRGKKNRNNRIAEDNIYHINLISKPNYSDEDMTTIFNGIFNDDRFNNIILSGYKERIIVFREDMLFPAFAISAVENMGNRCRETESFYHFDKTIQERMEKENYCIYPSPVDNQDELHRL